MNEMSDELTQKDVARLITELVSKANQDITMSDEQLEKLRKLLIDKIDSCLTMREHVRRDREEMERKVQKAHNETARIRAELAASRMKREPLDDDLTGSISSMTLRGELNDDFSETTSDDSDASGENKEPYKSSSNEPRVDFLSFINTNDAYLMLKEEPFPLGDTLNSERLGYPLGVAYDETLKEWLICDRSSNKIIRINFETDNVTVTETSKLKNPSAIMIFKEGRTAAVLCSEDQKKGFTIYLYNLIDKAFLRSYASYKEDMYEINHQMRGLAKSVGWNILSIDLPYNGPKRLRVFKKDYRGKAFNLPGAVQPSFLATYRGTVAISDLGNNKVFIYNLDDRQWDDIHFNLQRVIETELDLPIERLANESGFKFVSGMQFDVNGFLLIGDAKGHTIKLYDTEYQFLHRVSSDFEMPFMSTFCINSSGEAMILDVHAEQKLHWARLQSLSDILPWRAIHHIYTLNLPEFILRRRSPVLLLLTPMSFLFASFCKLYMIRRVGVLSLTATPLAQIGASLSHLRFLDISSTLRIVDISIFQWFYGMTNMEEEMTYKEFREFMRIAFDFNRNIGNFSWRRPGTSFS
ncbi:unnamed protein product [Caenorhabditis sp. 36 PRJEB53466]|nr:unnamed protein product [Caenorhabditis sp. 36 PRJEB53466]